MAMIDRPLVAVGSWFFSLSAASEAGDVVADVVLRILVSSRCSTCSVFQESPAPQYETRNQIASPSFEKYSKHCL